jgi:epoxyqueuosine reductase
MELQSIRNHIETTLRREVLDARTVTRYREPLVGYVSADDPGFLALRQHVTPDHMLPQDLLPGARTVISYFLPFAEEVVEANAQDRERVAREWGVAYVETNALIGRINWRLAEGLGERGVHTAAEPATYNYDPLTLVSRWSHKSVAVLAGIGSFGLNHLIITAAGCAGRLGSLVIDAAVLDADRFTQSDCLGVPAPKERCLYFHDGSCLECVMRCPVGALDENNEIDKQSCSERCDVVAAEFIDLGPAGSCGKCAIGPCAFASAV